MHPSDRAYYKELIEHLTDEELLELAEVMDELIEDREKEKRETLPYFI
ncbi:hypothetical protein [Candidatus Lokiarchaeum ossiferum]